MRRVGIVLLIATLAVFAGNAFAQITFENESQKQMVMTNLPSMPLAFTENRDQFGEKTLFKANAGGASFYFCKDEVAYLFVRDTDELIEDDFRPMHNMPDMPDKFDRPRYKKESLLIKAQFVAANPNAEAIGINRLAHNNNYFYGNDPEKWSTDVPNYSAIIYKNIYQGIDLKYYGDGKSMKYDFIVNPGADISKIRIRYDGVDHLSVSHSGDLQAQTRFGLIHEKVPYIYQEIGNAKHKVIGRYDIKESGVFGFAVDDGFNPDYPLIIDPELVYSTYLGGSSADGGYGIAVDGSGQAYIAGYTWSSNFPTMTPYDGYYNGGIDVFVTKFNSDGNTLIYSTYLGGSYDDLDNGIAVDGSGQAYITGSTSSGNFPTENPYSGNISGGYDAFVTKLNSDGNALIFSTYLGGSYLDRCNSIAIDASGQAYVTGYTQSTDFPTMNPYDGDHNGLNDAFITKFNSDGNALSYSTYLGGSSNDYGNGIAVDGSGQAYVTGYTVSNNFPTENPYDSDYNGSYDGFVTKLNSDGNALIYSTYLGGSSEEIGYGIAVDGSDYAYVAGYTYSTDFPTVNPYDGSHNGFHDGFVTKFHSDGSTLIYSTYLGGSNDDYSNSIAVDGSGQAYVTGCTRSDDFPAENLHNGEYDAFATKFNSDGNGLIYSAYVGGSEDDRGYSIDFDGSGYAYITGSTLSSDFPTANPYDDSNNGAGDVFVSKLGPSSEEIPTLSEWGMIILGLLVLALGTVAVIRRRRAVVAE